MRAEIVNVEDGGRIIVSKIKPIGDRCFCLEIHSGENAGFANKHALMTQEELYELGEAVRAILEGGRDLRRGP